MTPSSRRMLASMLLGNARQPVQHPLQAISNLANTYFGYKALGQADEAEKAKKLERSQAIARAFAPRSTSVPVVRHVGGHPGIDGRRVNLMENKMVPPNNKQIAQALLKIPGLETAAIGLMTKPPPKPIKLGATDRLVTPKGKVLVTSSPKKLTPGVDIPFPKNVFDQKTSLYQQKNQAAQSLKPPPSKMLDRYFDGRDAIMSGGEAIRALETALELSPIAYEGGMADARAGIMKDWLGSGGVDILPEGADEGAIATGRMTQKVQSQALSQLKLIFGGMPTEGERAMLLKVQGSANLPRAEREAIWRDAIALVKRRIQAKRAEMNVFENMFPSYKVPSVNSSSGGKRPAHITQEIWDEMTTDQKALF